MAWRLKSNITCLAPRATRSASVVMIISMRPQHFEILLIELEPHHRHQTHTITFSFICLHLRVTCICGISEFLQHLSPSCFRQGCILSWHCTAVCILAIAMGVSLEIRCKRMEISAPAHFSSFGLWIRGILFAFLNPWSGPLPEKRPLIVIVLSVSSQKKYVSPSREKRMQR